jgi:putative addiction module killer protein
MKLFVRSTPEFQAWLSEQDGLTVKRVRARLERVENEGHFGDHKHFADLTELRWKVGLRVYIAVIHPNVIVILGGNKNGQDKDIKKAKKILKRELQSFTDI